MDLLAMSDTRFAIFESQLIFFDGQHSLRIHHVLRELGFPCARNAERTIWAIRYKGTAAISLINIFISVFRSQNAN
jgi:hypothetical protein